MGNIHCATGHYEEALVWFRTANQLLPDDPITSVVLANTYHAIGDMDQADTLYRLAVEIDPNDKCAKHNLKRWEQLQADQGHNNEV